MGRGGDVVLIADFTDPTLAGFRDRRRFHAPSGAAGGKNQRHGANGEDILLHVPAGTVVRDADTDELLSDLDRPGARFVAGGGGRGRPRQHALRLGDEAGAARRRAR